MMHDESALIQGEIVVAKLYVMKQEKPKFRELEGLWLTVFNVLGVTFVFGSIGLTIGALLRGEIQYLKYALMALVPHALIATTIFLIKKSRSLNAGKTRNEQTIAVVDWLNRKTQSGEFGYVPKANGTLVWLTEHGVYGAKSWLIPWQRFTGHYIKRSSDTVEVVLMQSSFMENYSYIVLAVAVIIILATAIATLTASIHGLKVIGPRDDVLVAFAISGAILLTLAKVVYGAVPTLRDPGQKRYVALIDRRYRPDAEAISIISRHVPRSD